MSAGLYKLRHVISRRSTATTREHRAATCGRRHAVGLQQTSSASTGPSPRGSYSRLPLGGAPAGQNGAHSRLASPFRSRLRDQRLVRDHRRALASRGASPAPRGRAATRRPITGDRPQHLPAAVPPRGSDAFVPCRNCRAEPAPAPGSVAAPGWGCSEGARRARRFSRSAVTGMAREQPLGSNGARSEPRSR